MILDLLYRQSANFLSSVVTSNRLADGVLFGMPITLDVDENQIKALGIKPGARITMRDLRDDRNLAILTVEDVYQPDKYVSSKKTTGGA